MSSRRLNMNIVTFTVSLAPFLMLPASWLGDHVTVSAHPIISSPPRDVAGFSSDLLRHVITGENRSGAAVDNRHVTLRHPNVVIKVTNNTFSWSYKRIISHKPSFHQSHRYRRGLSDMLEMAGIDIDECTSVKRRRTVVVFTGEPLRLLCNPCKGSDSEERDIEWTKQVESTPEQRVGVVDSRVVLNADKSLQIMKASKGTDDGIYRCKVRQNYGAEVLGIYHVEVIAPSKDIKEIRIEGDDDRKPTGEEAIRMKDRSSVEVYTHWTQWGRCSVCDTAGDRARLGYCYAVRDLDHYANGIPCQSKLLPDEMRKRILKKRKNEKWIQECNVPCKQEHETLAQLMWSIHGGELADVSGLQGPAEIRRVAREGSTAELQCPRVDIGMVATWYNGSKRIDQEQILASKGMLTESIDSSLVIADVKRYNAGTYECRVDRQPRAVYRLVVINSLAATQEDIIKSIAILSGVLAGYAVLFVIILIARHCARVCAGMKNRRRRNR